VAEAAARLLWLAPFALMAAVLVGVGLLERRDGQRRAEQAAEYAVQRGYRFLPGQGSRLAYRLQGETGRVRWDLSADRVRRMTPRGQPAPETLWRTEDARLAGDGDLALIGYRPPGMQGKLRLDAGLLGGLVRQTLRIVFDMNLDGLSQQPAGSSLFQEKYVVLGRSAAAASQLLSPGLESRLLSWPDERIRLMPLGPLVAADGQGVVARLRVSRLPADEPAVLDDLIGIGLAAAGALRREADTRVAS
jgi:hypothetical protein